MKTDDPDWDDLPADVQLLQLNIREKCADAGREAGVLRNDEAGRDALTQAILAAFNQTTEDCGGIRIVQEEGRKLTVFVPRIAMWPYNPSE